jgi:hypothetical protein
LHYALDYELWMRIAQKYEMVKIDRYLATSRMYRDNKTVRLRPLGCSEAMSNLLKYYGYIPPNWVYGYLCARFSKTDGFFEADTPSFAKCAGAVALGTLRNWRRPLHYWADCTRLFMPGVQAVLRGRFE